MFTLSVLLFLPILAANQGAGIARRWHLPFSHYPISRRWLGENKTLAAYYMGPLLGVLASLLFFDASLRSIKLGLAIGLGVVVSEQLNSFIKRRCGLPPGSPWFVDRVDYALGGLAAECLVLGPLPGEAVVIVMVTAFFVHLIGNRISHKLGFRKTPW